MSVHCRLFFASFVHSFFGPFMGFSVTVYNVLDDNVKSFINESYYENYGKQLDPHQIEWLYSVLSSSQMVGYAICSIFIGYLTETFGRKGSTVVIKNILAITGSIISFSASYSNRFELLFIGRILAGSAAAFRTFHCVYINECAPVKSRGFVSIMPAIGYRLSAAVGMVVGLPQLLGTEEKWRFVFLIPAIMSAFHFFLGIFLPESPKHLYMTLNEKERARKSLIFYQGDQVNVEQVFAIYDQEKARTQSTRKIGLVKICSTKHLRWPFMLYFCIYSLSLVDGLDVTVTFSTTTLSSVTTAKNAAIYSIFLIELPTLVSMGLGLALATKVGRRPCLLVGLAATIVGNICIVITAALPNPFLAVIGMFLITTGHCAGPTLIQNSIAGELCPQIILPTVTSFVATVVYIVDIVVVSLYPPVRLAFGNGIMIIFAICSSFAFIFLFKCLPETRNRTITQVISHWLPEEDDETSSLLTNVEDILVHRSFGTKSRAAPEKGRFVATL